MKRIITISALVAALLPATTPPAAAQNREHVQMAAELRMLQEQQAQLALAMNQLAQALNEAMKTLDTRIDQSGRDMNRGFADQANTLRNVADDVRKIRESGQDTGVRLGELKEELEAMRQSMTAMLTRSTTFMPTGDPFDPDAPQSADALPPPPPPASTVGLSLEQTFNTAYSDYAAGQYSLAISGFEAFIRTFPTSGRADDAQFYIGEAEYAQNRWEQAIAAYNLAIQMNGDQVPNAYYKRGLALERLGRPDDARASWEMAIKTAPSSDSSVAFMAKQSLDRVPAAAPGRP